MAEVLDVTLGEQLKVVNLSPNPVLYASQIPTWNNRQYPIPGNGTAFLPFDLVKMLFGDPRSGEVVQRTADKYGVDSVIPDRLAEVRRLQQVWQNSTVKFREYIPGDRSFLDDGISDRAPTVEVYTLTGDRVYTVLDDPFGDRIIAAGSPTVAEKANTDRQLREQSEVIFELKKQNEALMRMLDMNPNDLGPDLPIGKDPSALATQDSVMEAPTVATVKEKPRMVYNPRTRRVVPRRDPVADPTTIEDLPEDTD